MVDAFNKPFRNKATSALPAQTQAEMQLHNDAEVTEPDEQDLLGVDTRRLGTAQDASTSTSTPSTQVAVSNGTAKRVHKFGSAADMPTASRSNPTSTPPARTTREPSPVWDIELDLNLPEEDDANYRTAKKGGDTEKEPNHGEDTVDPRLAKKRPSRYEDVEGNREYGDSSQRSLSPVFDIELDLN